jgi:HIP---CoA ligase
MVRASAARFARREAIVDGDQRISYAELDAMLMRSARAVLGAGIGPGDRVAIWAPNSAEYIIAVLGVLSAGAWIVPMNTRLKGVEAAYVLEKSRATAIMTVTDFLGIDYLGMLEAVMPRPAALDRTVILSGPAPSWAADWGSFLRSGDRVSEAEAERHIAALSPDDVCDVMFTSGTTGFPKGVLLTHRQSLRAYEAYNEGYGLREGDRHLVLNPFFHCFGYKAGWMLSFLVGATVVAMAVFDADKLLDTVATERISVLPGPPTLFISVLDSPHRADYDLSSLRTGFVSAAAVPVELVRRMRRELPIKTVATGYGLTECTAMVTVTAQHDEPETVASSSGKPIRGIEVRLVDPQGHDVADGHDGEILVRGFNVMKGYLDDPAATAAAIDSGGWLHTGDIGVRNSEGYLRITGRKKDIYIAGGFNVAPAEVESALLELEQISNAAVVGVPDHRLGEVGAAFVTPRPGHTVTPGEVVRWASQRLANYKVPRYVFVTASLPVNASGKVLKHVLQQEFAEMDQAARTKAAGLSRDRACLPEPVDVVLPESPVGERLVGLLTGRGRGSEISGRGTAEARPGRGLDDAAPLDEGLPGLVMRMQVRLGQREHRRDAGIRRREDLGPLIARPGPEQGRQPLLHRRPVGRIGPVAELGLLDAQVLEHLLPERLLERADGHVPAVERLVDLVEGRAGIADVRARPVLPSSLGQHAVQHHGQRRRPVDHRRVDDLALPRGARLQQGAHQAECQEQPSAAHVADQVDRRNRPLPGAGEVVKGTGQGDVVDVMPGRRGQRSFLPPAGHPPVDQPGVPRQAGVRTEAEPFHHARAEAFHQRVRARDEPKHRFPPLGVLEVDGDRTAPPVHDVTLRGLRQHACRRPAAVAGQRRPVDPYHLCAQVGEQHGAERRRADRGHLDHADPRQRPGQTRRRDGTHAGPLPVLAFDCWLRPRPMTEATFVANWRPAARRASAASVSIASASASVDSEPRE